MKSNPRLMFKAPKTRKEFPSDVAKPGDLLSTEPLVKMNSIDAHCHQRETDRKKLARSSKNAATAFHASTFTGPSLFFTITLQKRLRDGVASVTDAMTPVRGCKLGAVLRNKFLIAVYGKWYRWKNIRHPWVHSYETGELAGRPHLHGLVQVPEGWTIEQTERTLMLCASEIEWVYGEYDAELADSVENVISYIKKKNDICF